MEARDSRRTRLENLSLIHISEPTRLVYLHCETMRCRCLQKNRKKPDWKKMRSSVRIKRCLSAGVPRWNNPCTGSGKKSLTG